MICSYVRVSGYTEYPSIEYLIGAGPPHCPGVQPVQVVPVGTIQAASTCGALQGEDWRAPL